MNGFFEDIGEHWFEAFTFQKTQHLARNRLENEFRISLLYKSAKRIRMRTKKGTNRLAVGKNGVKMMNGNRKINNEWIKMASQAIFSQRIHENILESHFIETFQGINENERKILTQGVEESLKKIIFHLNDYYRTLHILRSLFLVWKAVGKSGVEHAVLYAMECGKRESGFSKGSQQDQYCFFRYVVDNGVDFIRVKDQHNDFHCHYVASLLRCLGLANGRNGRQNKEFYLERLMNYARSCSEAEGYNILEESRKKIPEAFVGRTLEDVWWSIPSPNTTAPSGGVV